jgi:large subunit ribosomal protein L17
MRHRKSGRKLGTDASHRQAMLKTMAAQIIEHGRVQTTETKAKEVRPVVDKIITLAKRGDLHAKRQILGDVSSRPLAHKIFTEVAEKYADRAGGYTRISKIGPRHGDGAPLVFIELV